MRYEKASKLSAKEFRRKTGVKRKTFAKMVEILKTAEAAKRRKGGHESKLTVEDMLLLALEYMREYRTYFHIGLDFGVHESMAWRIHRWVEDTLIKDGAFSLPGKKALARDDTEYETIQIDATETPVERPKRGKNFTTRERKSVTQ
jgi:hypothetical protein